MGIGVHVEVIDGVGDSVFVEVGLGVTVDVGQDVCVGRATIVDFR